MARELHILLLLFTTSIIFAQIPTSLIEPVDKIEEFHEYEGSIYKYLSFKVANVIDEKSGTFDIKLRYNIYTDELEFKKADKLYRVIKEVTTHARINEEYYYFCNFKDQRNRNKNGYYVLVELSDNYSIYKKYTVDMVHPKKRVSVVSSGQNENGEIKLNTTYYLEEKGVIVELPTNKKELVSTFGDMKDQLLSYIKNEKIRPRKEEDLKRFVAKYNALKNIESNGRTRSLLSNN